MGTTGISFDALKQQIASSLQGIAFLDIETAITYACDGLKSLVNVEIKKIYDQLESLKKENEKLREFNDFTKQKFCEIKNTLKDNRNLIQVNTKHVSELINYQSKEALTKIEQSNKNYEEFVKKAETLSGTQESFTPGHIEGRETEPPDSILFDNCGDHPIKDLKKHRDIIRGEKEYSTDNIINQFKPLVEKHPKHKERVVIFDSKSCSFFNGVFMYENSRSDGVVYEFVGSEIVNFCISSRVAKNLYWAKIKHIREMPKQ